MRMRNNETYCRLIVCEIDVCVHPVASMVQCTAAAQQLQHQLAGQCTRPLLLIATADRSPAIQQLDWTSISIACLHGGCRKQSCTIYPQLLSLSLHTDVICKQPLITAAYCSQAMNALLSYPMPQNHLNLSNASTGRARISMIQNSGMASVKVQAANKHARMLASSLLNPAARAGGRNCKGLRILHVDCFTLQ